MSRDRLFLDANILFSAAYRAASGLMVLWGLRHVEILSSHYAAQEASRNLYDGEQRARLVRLLESVEMADGMASLPKGIELPEKDRPILQAAIYAGASHLLTGDLQHFGPYFGRRFEGVLVTLPAEYLRRRS